MKSATKTRTAQQVTRTGTIVTKVGRTSTRIGVREKRKHAVLTNSSAIPAEMNTTKEVTRTATEAVGTMTIGTIPTAGTNLAVHPIGWTWLMIGLQ